MIDTVHLTTSIMPSDIKWENFHKVKRRKDKGKNKGEIVYKAQVGTILFNYYKTSRTLLVISNTHRVLNKFDITINDLQLFVDEINSAINKVVKNNNVQLEISRIDCCA